MSPPGLLCDLNQCRKGSQIAFHTEDAVGGDKSESVIGTPIRVDTLSQIA